MVEVGDEPGNELEFEPISRFFQSRQCRVVEGAPYRVSAIEFAGSSLAPASAWDGMVKLHAGGKASRRLLLESVTPIDKTYDRQGYTDEYVVSGRSWIVQRIGWRMS